MRPLLSLIAVLAGTGLSAAEVTYLGTYVWDGAGPRFGGFSGIEVQADGLQFLALSDRAMLIAGEFIRTDGLVTGVIEQGRYLLRDTAGAPLVGERHDSEGLAVGADGQIYISFEGLARVRTQPGVEGPPRLLPDFAAFGSLQANAGLEALAIGPDGALYTIPERSGIMQRPFPVYRLADGTWDVVFTLPRRGSFLVAGADIGPDRRLYVLERDFVGIGFRTRVRRFDLAGGSEEVLLETAPLTHDNLEGIAVWDAGQGLRITLISDDNFRFFQQTQIVEYAIGD